MGGVTYDPSTYKALASSTDLWWHDVAGQFWFYLSELAPYAVGAGLSELRGQLDERTRERDVLAGHDVVIDGCDNFETKRAPASLDSSARGGPLALARSSPRGTLVQI